MPHEINDIEIINVLNFPRYAPRLKPTPIPTAEWDAAPLYRVCLNDEWVSHIIGLLMVLDQPDTWIGTDEEVLAARRQVNEIILHFMECRVMSCCCEDPTIPIQRRVTSDGQLQISRDGGLTWIQDPEDPRLTATALPPPVTSGVSGTKCDAATNAVEHLQDVQAGVSNHLSLGLTAIELAAIVIGLLVALFFSGGFLAVVLIPLIIQIMVAIANLAPEEYDAIFTNDVWDKTLCVLYCHIGDDGHFDQAGFDAVANNLQTKLPGGDSPVGAAANMASFVKVWGLIGLNNACATGNAADADCSSCDCGFCQSKWATPPATTIYGKKSDDQTGLGDNADNKVRFETLDINTNNLYYVIVITGGDDDGCLLKSAIDTPSAGVGTTAYSLVGAGHQTDYGNYTIGSPNADSACVSGLLFASAAPFSIVLEFADC